MTVPCSVLLYGVESLHDDFQVAAWEILAVTLLVVEVISNVGIGNLGLGVSSLSNILWLQYSQLTSRGSEV